MDELANITTARDGKEEMARCEEIFRQICWLRERFWPDVDGMGEQDESVRMGPGIGPMGPGLNNGMTGPMNNGINNSMGPPNMTGMSNMTGPMSAGLNGTGVNTNDGASVQDNRTSFGLPNGNGLEDEDEDS